MTTKKISAHEVVVINFLPLEGRITLKQTDIYSPKLSLTNFFLKHRGFFYMQKMQSNIYMFCQKYFCYFL